MIYRPRPGAYALAIRGSGVLVVEEESGLFLPGGGIEPGEPPEEALCREVMEETGFVVEDATFLARARQFALNTRNEGFDKDCHMYRVTLGAQTRTGDCPTRWLAIEEARVLLAHEVFQWVVEQYGAPDQSPTPPQGLR